MAVIGMGLVSHAILIKSNRFWRFIACLHTLLMQKFFGAKDWFQAALPTSAPNSTPPVSIPATCPSRAAGIVCSVTIGCLPICALGYSNISISRHKEQTVCLDKKVPCCGNCKWRLTARLYSDKGSRGFLIVPIEPKAGTEGS